MTLDELKQGNECSIKKLSVIDKPEQRLMDKPKMDTCAKHRAAYYTLHGFLLLVQATLTLKTKINPFECLILTNINSGEVPCKK